MEPPNDREPRAAGSTADPRVSRRALVRAGGGVAAATLGAGVAGGASAQITTDGALPADAPTLENDNYPGLFVRVGDEKSDADTAGVGSCEFIEEGTGAVAYEATLVDKGQEGTRTADTTLYAAEGNADVNPEKAFVVNAQNSCGEEFVGVNLEQIGESQLADGTAESTSGTVEVGVQDTSSQETPGFGAVTALAGLAGAAAVALGRAIRS